VVLIHNNDTTRFWGSRDNGAHFAPLTGLHGLPSDSNGHVRHTSDRGYLAMLSRPSPSFYRSTDGLSRRRVTIR